MKPLNSGQLRVLKNLSIIEGSLLHLMLAIAHAHAHASTRATGLMRVKNSTRHFYL